MADAFNSWRAAIGVLRLPKGELGSHLGTVLVVDDDAETAEALRRMLVRRGHEAVAVTDGARAIDWLAGCNRWPELIVLDWMMPGLAGGDVMKAIRDTPACAGVRVVVLSKAFEDRLAQEAFRLGAKDYLVKGTMGWDEIVQKLEDQLAQSAGPFA
jgi:PleD family two-component response regulator